MRKINFSQVIPQSGFYQFHGEEKERSTEAVPTGRIRHTFTRVLKLGSIFLTLNLWTILSTAHLYPPSADLLCTFEMFSTPFSDQRR